MMRARPRRHLPHRFARPVRARLAAAALLVAGAGLAGCSGDDTGTPSTGAAADATPTKSQAPAVSPLTGAPMTRQPRHPVLAVKIDNSARSAPQSGLGSADMVVEELVEGGITRLATFFYSKLPPVVGPVRSMRATDIGIVRPLEATLVASGGAPQTVQRIRDAHITAVTEGATGYYRDSGRSAPYNLMMRLDELAGTLKPPATAPEPYLPFGEGLPAGKPARGLTARFSPSSSSTFELRAGKYANTDTYAAAGDTFAADTVLVLRVQVGDAGYLDPAGNRVPETKFTGRGKAMVFHGGRVVQGSWIKDGLDAPVDLVDARNQPMTIPAGKVWIELVPAAGGDVTTVR